MRQTISGLIAAIAVMTASAVPAMACGGGLFTSCSPCGQQEYVSPCGQPEVYAPPVYVSPAPAYTGCNTCNSGWAHEQLPDPVHQYYYVNQGPTYTGPGDFAPHREYDESANLGWIGYHHRHHYYGYGQTWHHHYGYRYGMMPHHYGYGYGHHEHLLRRYY